MRLANVCSLKNSTEFSNALRATGFFRHRFFVLGLLRRSDVVLPSSRYPAEYPCLGLVVSKKSGSSVVRNKIKRRIRNLAVRHLPVLQASDVCCLVIGRRAAALGRFCEIEGVFLSALRHQVGKLRRSV